MAQSSGYDCTFLHRRLLAPLRLGSFLALPNAIRQGLLSSPQENRGVVNGIITRITTFAIPLTIVYTGCSGLLTLLGNRPSRGVGLLGRITFLTAWTRLCLPLTVILDVQSLYHAHVTQNRYLRYYQWQVAATVAGIGALISRHSAIRGALWVTHVGCNLRTARALGEINDLINNPMSIPDSAPVPQTLCECQGCELLGANGPRPT